MWVLGILVLIGEDFTTVGEDRLIMRGGVVGGDESRSPLVLEGSVVSSLLLLLLTLMVDGGDDVGECDGFSPYVRVVGLIDERSGVERVVDVE